MISRVPRGKNTIPDVRRERVQKVLAHAGLGSRREIEQWVIDGRVKINGVKAKLGDRLQASDFVQINGRKINLVGRLDSPTRVLIYHKPSGEVVTRRDPDGKATIFTQLPKLKKGRWIAVGRLDINTQGLLLVTNNGDFANRLMHPSHQVDREYAARVLGQVNDKLLDRLRNGVNLDGRNACFDAIQFAGGEGANRWYHVTVSEGRNRIVRRLWESQGLRVNRLIRIRYGSIVLPEKLKARTFCELDEKKLAALMRMVGIQPPNEQPLQGRYMSKRRKNR